MTEYNKENVKLSYQLNKLKAAIRKQAKGTFIIITKMFDRDELPLNKSETQRHYQNEPKWGLFTQ